MWFPKRRDAALVAALCVRDGAEVAPRCPKGGKKEPNGSLLGARGGTFWRHGGETRPMRKHQYLLWFSHIIGVLAPPVSHSKSTRERNVQQMRSFSLLYAHFGRQSDAQGRPKRGPREPKGSERSPRAPPGTPKNHQKIDLGPHLGIEGDLGGSRGPPGGKKAPKSTAKRLFYTAPRPEKRRAFRLVLEPFWV